MAHRVTAQAEADLDRLWLYVARECSSMDVATRLVDSIAERFVLLAGFPNVGRARPEFGTRARSFVVGDYIIVYDVEADYVRILRVIHGRRDIEGLFAE